MNKEYIKEIFEENKENLIDSEYEINSPEDLESFLESYIISNLQYDFHIYPDANKLFNRPAEKDKELINENLEIEKEK